MDARDERGHDDLIKSQSCRFGRKSGYQLPQLIKQALHQAPRQNTGDPAAVMAGRECRLHRHDLITHQRVETSEDARIQRAAAEFGGAGEPHRAWIGASEGDAQVGVDEIGSALKGKGVGT